MKNKEHPENKQLVQWKMENLTRQPSEPDAEQWVIMDMVSFNMVFQVRLFLIALMATVTIIYYQFCF